MVRVQSPIALAFCTPIWTPIMAKGITDRELKALLDKPPAHRVELNDGTIDGLNITKAGATFWLPCQPKQWLL
jgi:hypothetical protein